MGRMGGGLRRRVGATGPAGNRVLLRQNVVPPDPLGSLPAVDPLVTRPGVVVNVPLTGWLWPSLTTVASS